MSIGDRRLDFVQLDLSFVQLKKHIKEMFKYHGYLVGNITMQPGLFYDDIRYGVDFMDDYFSCGGKAYFIDLTVKISDIDHVPQKIEGLLLDLKANNKL